MVQSDLGVPQGPVGDKGRVQQLLPPREELQNPCPCASVRYVPIFCRLLKPPRVRLATHSTQNEAQKGSNSSPPLPHPCRCHSGYVGTRCEHADLLAVVAANQKKQTITALLVVAVVASAVLIAACVLIHCCRLRKRCGCCRVPLCGQEKPSGLLKGGASCCHTESVV
ncbi:protransforming growth factor alpha isoform X1 [Tympanuchus pallidicinctus]|uniref:protransforming growth factor alpha isoform X1 n=1 Tax=Tympanuchus pallidicinctus TaxID=109042 RepID=UPI002286F703|nr:protransforming growth factor alpha isoform X1 [Tympanuchus pallidicinctus]XP_052558289.1 protransforming growth factor alpha isoform X1 [Tympanuchus pallidicinctus]XP_052558290.1 protransforming growth factor alpha isoform X1 [Tympanuchus pallidicinctus]XP_052558291.1 protransforming growth factor alpha isoform X1 [Tympanuchus pallidicinctus]XP_052558292.1 protransforming growth factor alpha isoform X1 [Tympanuchus pallidicinctus]XP_052558293.1 protransforming growth factor alpha isoform X